MDRINAGIAANRARRRERRRADFQHAMAMRLPVRRHLDRGLALRLLGGQVVPAAVAREHMIRDEGRLMDHDDDDLQSYADSVFRFDLAPLRHRDDPMMQQRERLVSRDLLSREAVRIAEDRAAAAIQRYWRQRRG